MFRTVLTSLLAVLVLCGSAFAAEKTLIAAANPTWPPMEFLDENKNIIGYDRDIIAAIAEEIGMKSESATSRGTASSRRSNPDRPTSSLPA